jgi:hypothetical protein
MPAAATRPSPVYRPRTLRGSNALPLSHAESFLNAVCPPYFFFTSSRTSSASSFLFFSLALYSPLLFMVKSHLDPDEIKRRVLMFIGWKKVHIAPERREFN